jgi:hypothetical protein
MQSWAVARLHKSVPPVVRLNPSRPHTGQQVWLVYGAESAGPYAPGKVARYFRCEALEEPEKLRGFAVAHLMHEELMDTLFA